MRVMVNNNMNNYSKHYCVFYYSTIFTVFKVPNNMSNYRKTNNVFVYTEAARVLRTGGVMVISFTDKCLASKALLGWKERGNLERSQVYCFCFSFFVFMP